MNIKRFLPRVFILIPALLFTISSCRKDERPVYDYFISNDLKISFPVETINAIMDYVSPLYPKLNDLKPFVGDGINVYKMVYKTTVNGKEINASGLVCMPSLPGEYPVLSFQNGTNTVNSFAPSEDITNSYYLLIESISSMGFVVIIPDYPGFGESVQIPHPYLISEPTVQSIVDMLRALKESSDYEFDGIRIKNEYYLLGYSQGGWATMNLHKALEINYPDEFNLKGSACGAGPYNMYNLFLGMVNATTYPMPSYLGYIINAYSSYHQFTNPVSDLLNEPYAALLSTLYSGTLSLDQINDQLTTNIQELLKADFISGFASSQSFSSVRDALINNSVAAWNTSKPLLLIHGQGDTHVSVNATESMYEDMINAGTSAVICKKILFPELDHGEAVIPAMTEGLLYFLSIRYK